jgi:hypothetical protein
LIARLSRAELKDDCGRRVIATMLFETVHRAPLFKKQDKGESSAASWNHF